MTYVLLHVDLSGLDDAEVDAFADAASSLDLDVIDLAPDLADTGITILISTSVAALATKLAEMAGGDAAERLWDLVRRLWRRDTGQRAIEDRERRISFIFDDAVRQAGPTAMAEMLKVAATVDAIKDGTTLRWSPEIQAWSADQRG